MTSRKYSQNDEFFDVPNLENSYWAGFIAADGYIALDHGRKAVAINLHKKDRCVLEGFSEAIDYTGPIYEGVNNWDVPWVRVVVSSAPMVRALWKNFNVKAKKSLTLKFPTQLPYNCQLAFIKGYIDGDGSIWRSKKGYLYLDLVGTEQFLTKVNAIFGKISPGNNSVRLHSSKRIHRICISTRRAKKVLGVLDALETPALERKWSALYREVGQASEIQKAQAKEKSTTKKNRKKKT